MEEKIEKVDKAQKKVNKAKKKVLKVARKLEINKEDNIFINDNP